MVEPGDVPDIVVQTIVRGEVVSRLTYHGADGCPCLRQPDIPFFSGQKRVVLRNCGTIDPTDIDAYIARGGYEALAKALEAMSPADVLETVKASGLRGRGGAGFPTGRKWELAAAQHGDKKYVICNADEGDPGAFMDRGLLEGDTHAVIEGMLIGAYAMGADDGYVYCRAEYPGAIKHLGIALNQAEERGLLGDDILGSGFSFHLQVKEGAGVLRAAVDVPVVGAHCVGADQHALDHGVSVALQEPAVHERPGVAFVGVADHVLLVAVLCGRELPLAPRREAGAAAAAQPARLDRLEYISG